MQSIEVLKGIKFAKYLQPLCEIDNFSLHFSFFMHNMLFTPMKISNDYPRFFTKNKQRLSNDYQNLKSANYSSLSNKHAARLIIFLKKSNLHGLITSCTFINFWNFSSLHVFFTIDSWKIPTCTALLHPARLLISGNFPACTFITSCTIIR